MLKMLKTLLNRVLAGAVAVATILPLVIVPVMAEEPTTYYEFFYEDSGGTKPFVNVLEKTPTVWVNGGKATLPIGSVVDNKTRQIYAFQRSSDENARVYNMTTSKKVLWGVSSSEVTSSNFTKTKKYTASNGMIKVSKGKLTAGKVGGRVYVYAVLRGNDKNGADDTLMGCFPVDIKIAPQKVETYKSVVDTKQTKTLAVPINVAKSMYVKAYAKSGTVSNDATYTLSIVKNPENAVVVDEAGDPHDFLVLTHEELTGMKYGVMGLKFDEVKGNSLPATLQIMCNQNGKKATVKLEVSNPIVEQDNFYWLDKGDITLEVASDIAGEHKISLFDDFVLQTAKTRGLIIEGKIDKDAILARRASENPEIPEEDTLGEKLIDKSTTSKIYTYVTSKAPEYTDLVAKNKVKFNTKIKSTLATANFSTTTGVLTIVAKKRTMTETTETVYVTVQWGAEVDEYFTRPVTLRSVPNKSTRELLSSTDIVMQLPPEDVEADTIGAVVMKNTTSFDYTADFQLEPGKTAGDLFFYPEQKSTSENVTMTVEFENTDSKATITEHEIDLPTGEKDEETEEPITRKVKGYKLSFAGVGKEHVGKTIATIKITNSEYDYTNSTYTYTFTASQRAISDDTSLTSITITEVLPEPAEGAEAPKPKTYKSSGTAIYDPYAARYLMPDLYSVEAGTKYKVSAVTGGKKSTASITIGDAETDEFTKSAGFDIILVTVTAEDGTTKSTYQMMVNESERPKSSDTRLASLKFESTTSEDGKGITLREPTLTILNDEGLYTNEVIPAGVYNIRATTLESHATISISTQITNDALKTKQQQATVKSGKATTVTILVTAEDGSTSEYIVILGKTDGDATLHELKLLNNTTSSVATFTNATNDPITSDKDNVGTIEPGYYSIYATPTSKAATYKTTVKINSGGASSVSNTYTSKTFKNDDVVTITVAVTAPDGTKVEYPFKITVKSSS